MSGVTVDTAETADVVSVTEIKRQLRIATSDSTFDTMLGVVRDASISISKEYLNRSLVNRTLKLSLDTIPYQEDVIPDKEGISVGPYITI